MTADRGARPLPCPWCGAQADVRTNDDDGAAPWLAAWVQCSRGRGCEVGGPVVKLAKDKDARSAAIAAWNKVAANAARGSEVEGAREAVETLRAAYTADALAEWFTDEHQDGINVRAVLIRAGALPAPASGSAAKEDADNG